MKKLISSLIVTGVLCAPMTASAYALLGSKWGSPVNGTGATVTYSYFNAGQDCSAVDGPGCTFVSLAGLGGVSLSDWKTQIRRAFDSWSAVANITFIEVADDGSPYGTGDSNFSKMRIGAHKVDGVFGALAYARQPYTDEGGDFIFDSDEDWKSVLSDPGFDIFYVTAHEVGHGIGLDHTAVPNSLMNPVYTEAYSGPQADDKAGAQYLYGNPLTVPEPGTAALAGLALLGLTLRRRTTAK